MSRICIIALAIAAGLASAVPAAAQTPPPKKPDSTSMSDSMPGMDMGDSTSKKKTAARDSSMPSAMRSMPGMLPDSGMAPMQGMQPMTADAMMIGPLGISMDRM